MNEEELLKLLIETDPSLSSVLGKVKVVEDKNVDKDVLNRYENLVKDIHALFLCNKIPQNLFLRNIHSIAISHTSRIGKNAVTLKKTVVKSAIDGKRVEVSIKSNTMPYIANVLNNNGVTILRAIFWVYGNWMWIASDRYMPDEVLFQSGLLSSNPKIEGFGMPMYFKKFGEGTPNLVLNMPLIDHLKKILIDMLYHSCTEAKELKSIDHLISIEPLA